MDYLKKKKKKRTFDDIIRDSEVISQYFYRRFKWSLDYFLSLSAYQS